MNLIDCRDCGAVFNKDRLIFPHEGDYLDELPSTMFYWDGEDFIPFIHCPVCSGVLFKE